MKFILSFIFHGLFPTIFFNFRYLPFNQAIKLPILLYKPKFLKLNGSIKISSPIRTGMIRLGWPIVPSLYPNDGIVIEIREKGSIIFEGNVKIGNFIIIF